MRKNVSSSNIRSYDRNGTTTAYGTPVAGYALEMDRLSYGYTEVSLNGRQVLASNRLRHVKDQVSDAGRYTEDIDNQADDNYSYDAIGNLVGDQQGGNEEIRWTVYGKIAGIHKTDGTKVYYSYDASGNRISKTVDRSGSTNPSAGVTTTWYVRDAQGNVLSTYEKRGSSPLEQTELHLYGSSRLGIQRTGGLVVEGSLVSLYTYSTETLVRGRKLYELSNHLGNVLATITDKKVLVSDGGSVGGTGGVCANGGLVEVLDVYNRDGALSSYRARQEINFYSAFESGSSDEWEGYIDAGATSCDNNGGSGTGSGMPAGAYYVADLVSATDYAPFGMGLVGRTYNSGSYKFGFNGQERSTEIGDDSYTAEFWQYDSRIGRRWNVDPVTKMHESPYACFSNNPVWHIDVKGDTDSVPASLGIKKYDISSWFSPLTKLIPNTGTIEHSHADDINYLFKGSGGEEYFKKNSNILMQMNSSLQSVRPGTIAIKETSPTTTNLNSAYYSASESGTERSWVNLLLGGMIKGTVPENIVFSSNGTVSSYLIGSPVYESLLSQWDALGRPSNNTDRYGFTYGFGPQVSDLTSSFTFYTMSNFVGSAAGTVLANPAANTITMTITNVTTVHSGDLMKHLPWHWSTPSPYLLRKPNVSSPQPYTNFSQTFQFKLNYSETIRKLDMQNANIKTGKNRRGGE